MCSITVSVVLRTNHSSYGDILEHLRSIQSFFYTDLFGMHVTHLPYTISMSCQHRATLQLVDVTVPFLHKQLILGGTFPVYFAHCSLRPLFRV